MAHIKSPSITLSQLYIRYHHHWLFDQFHFELEAGKWTCLLGPSGIGKTTLLRFIAGLQSDQETECSGTIEASDDFFLADRLSYLTQKDSLFPWLNVLDNVLIGFSLRNEKITEELKEKAQYFLEKVGLKKVSDLKPDHLSVGMRQRVALARTLIEDRQVILMDEPFSSLDAIARLKLQDLAVELLANHTVMLITHDPLEALRVGDKIYIIDGEPAKIVHTVKPLGKKPRSVTDKSLFRVQAELFEILNMIDGGHKLGSRRL